MTFTVDASAAAPIWSASVPDGVATGCAVGWARPAKTGGNAEPPRNVWRWLKKSGGGGMTSSTAFTTSDRSMAELSQTNRLSESMYATSHDETSTAATAT